MPDRQQLPPLSGRVAAMLRTPRALLIPADVREVLALAAIQIDALSRRVEALEALEARHPTSEGSPCQPSPP